MTGPFPARPPRTARAAAAPLPRSLALLIALLLLGLPTAGARSAPGAPAPSSGAEVQLESRVFEIARQLRCPVCVSESVGDSSSPIAIQMRDQIQEQLRDGRSEREILAFFQERYGDWILLEPPRRGVHLVVWLLPAIAFVAGAGGLTWLVMRWMRTARRPVEASEEDLARVRAALSEPAAPEDAEAGR